MNQFPRLGFRILGKACLKQMGTVGSFFLFSFKHLEGLVILLKRLV